MRLVSAFGLEFRGVGVRLVNVARLHRQKLLLGGLAAYKLSELSNPACNYGEAYMTAIKSLPYFPDSDESSFGRRLKT